jgi:phage baseplate assembly protein V
MLRFGNISEFNPQTGYARVTFIDDGIVSDWLQVLVKNSLENKYFHALDVNEQVACLMDDNLEDGVILGAIYSDKITPNNGNKDVVKVNFSDGSFVEYNRESHEYNINIKGKININAESDIKIISDSKVNIEGSTEVNINAVNANITATTIAKIQAPAIQLNGAVAVTGAITVSGTLTAPSGQPIQGDLRATGNVESGGNMLVGGNIDVTSEANISGNINAQSNITTPGEISGGIVKDGTIILGTHVHAGVQTGSGTTAPPTP